MVRLVFRSFTIVAFLALCSSTLFGQRPNVIPAQINGQVRFTKGGAPAGHILVRLETFSGGVVAEMWSDDRTGKFSFSGLQLNQYQVVIRAQGYREVNQHVDLETVSNAYLQLQLVPEENGSENVNRPAASPVEIDAKVPQAARKEYELGLKLSGEGSDLGAAVAHLEKAVTLYPDFLQAQLLLGTAYLDTHQLDKAEVALRQALIISPKSAGALFSLGEVYRRQKRYPEAEKALQEGLKIEPRSYTGHLALGRIYWETGDIAKAGPEVGRAIQLKPDFADAHLLAGNILLRARQADNALIEYQEYLKLAPNGASAKEVQATVEKIKRGIAAGKK